MRRSLTALVAAGVAALSLIASGATVTAANAAPATPQKNYQIVIDQVATLGPAGEVDQYVQLKNVSHVTQNLGGWAVDVAISPNQRQTLATIPSTVSLPPGEVLVIANLSSPLQPTTYFQYFNGTVDRLFDKTGIALVTPTGQIVDSMATTSISPFAKGIPAPPMTPFQQFQALVRYTNTDNNLADFRFTFRSPGVPGPYNP